MSINKTPIKTKHGLTIRVPTKGFGKTTPSLKNQYLWFGHGPDESFLGTVQDKRHLKKIRNWINEILGEASHER